MSKKNEDLTITKEQLKSVLDQCYNKALDGIPQVSDPIERLCEHYLSKHQTVEKAAKGLIARQKLKCAASGFLAGIGGFFTLPVALPANLASVFYVQLRMIAALAMLGGLDPRDEQVHTLCYLCLTGTALNDIIKGKKPNLFDRMTTAGYTLVTGDEVDELNEQIMTKVFAKISKTGLLNMGKTIPVVGGFLGGHLDLMTTNAIADNAFQLFIAKSIVF